jgi:phage baseplate assembly protein W
MASLNFNVLKKPSVTINKYTFSDLHLDFTNPVKRDIAADYDEGAIRNSIVNLFNTIPGQNLLNPLYGLNLVQFLFTPASDTNARLMGDKILKQISNYEPRVTVENVNVDVNPDEQMYTITLSIIMSALNKKATIAGILTSNGFTLLS